MKVSIVMLTYNAHRYVKHSICSLKRNTEGITYELVVCDNSSSEKKTKDTLRKLYSKGYIDNLNLC